MADRDTSIPGNQIQDDSINQTELDITNTPTDGQIIKINMPTGDMTAIDLGDIGDITTMQTNIVLNAFRIAINGSLTQFNMVDGIVDEYEDENSVDLPNSTNESYDAVNDLYSPSLIEPSTLSLLLDADGSDGATSLSDLSANNHTLTFNGNAQLDTAFKKFGTASMLFDGAGDFVSIPADSTFEFGTGDFTVDLHVRFANATGNITERILGDLNSAGNSGAWFIQRNADETLSMLFNTGTQVINSSAITDTNFHHIRFGRNGNTAHLYVDGVSQGTVDMTGVTLPVLSATNLGIGRQGDFDGDYFDGHIDAVRIQKGVAVDATGFTPPTEMYSKNTLPSSMTLISDIFTAEATPTNARIVLFEEDVDSVTLNTDLKAFVTRDAGQTFTTDFATDDKLDITSHGFSNDDRIMVTSSAQDLPAGLDSATVYFIINATTNDFELSLTSSGSAVDITDNGTGTHTAKQVSEITLANDGEYETGKNILTGSVDISGQPSGTSMEYQLVTANDKDLNIHGTGLSWD